jgi:hypothetical protein
MKSALGDIDRALNLKTMERIALQSGELWQHHSARVCGALGRIFALGNGFHAPPAYFILHFLHSHMPTATRLNERVSQLGHL